jgi:uncharacterized protein (UPF0264 family)
VTALLASVRSAEEASQALAGGADLIDFKEPAEGALGRLPDGVIRASLAVLNGARPTSATAGDLPLSSAPAMVAAARGIAATGVDFVKIGMFGGGRERDAAVDALAMVAADGVALIAVLFADRPSPTDTDFIGRCADAGFRGVMLDTAEKAAGPLLRHLGAGALGRFVETAKRRGLLTGLAGSLRVEDVAALTPLGADYLGFRTALTRGDRTGALDPDRIAAVRARIDQAGLAGAAAAAARRASEAAGAASAAASAMAGVADSTRSAKLR